MTRSVALSSDVQSSLSCVCDEFSVCDTGYVCILNEADVSSSSWSSNTPTHRVKRSAPDAHWKKWCQRCGCLLLESRSSRSHEGLSFEDLAQTQTLRKASNKPPAHPTSKFHMRRLLENYTPFQMGTLLKKVSNKLGVEDARNVPRLLVLVNRSRTVPA